MERRPERIKTTPVFPIACKGILEGDVMKTLARCTLALLAALAAGPALQAHAAGYPERPVTLVVPFPPGGGTDAGARLLAHKLAERWGQSVVIENRPGAAGIIGVDHVARAKPDGYTLLIGNIGTQAINQSLYRKIPYNPDTAFTPISLVAELPLVLVVNPSVPAKTPQELIALAKARPGELTYSTSGAGSSMHLAAKLFESGAGIKLLHVPYKGGGPALQDLVGGQVNMSFATVLETSGQIKAGHMRALAVTSDKRSPTLPEVPTLAESAIPGFNSISWIGLLAPAGTPAPIVDKIAADVHAVMNAPDVQQRFSTLGAIPVGDSPADFSALIKHDTQRYAALIKQIGITLQ